MSFTSRDRDFSMEQTAAGLSNTHGIPSSFKVTKKEIEILQELAYQIKELANRPIEEEKKKLWTAHNDLQSVRPLVFCDPENGWNEIITQDQIKCNDPLLRVWEMSLRKEIFWGKEMKDDKVIEPIFYVPYYYNDSEYGLKEIKEQTCEGGSFHYLSPIVNYETDFQKITNPEITVDYVKTTKIIELAHEIFDEILEVKLRGIWWWTLGMTWDFIKLRGLENFMMDLIVYPDWVHKMMNFLTESVHKKLDFLENNSLLSLNTGGTYVGSGGFGWTNQLPKEISSTQKVKVSDMWGFCESQETVGVSPEMFGEFIFPYQKTILERFGLNCYGCCEPLDPRWDYIKQIPNLRRVSVSPWANVPLMAEYLENNFVMSLKPSPTPLANNYINENEIRMDLEKKLKVTKNCRVELIMKDNHTLGNNPLNATRWCAIAQELVRNL
ncbi:MAG: hypothetical protein LLF95_06315 [Bacteroidales bacterium]|nr:hypothetical protein [Bacteroidales bacterium]